MTLERWEPHRITISKPSFFHLHSIFGRTESIFREVGRIFDEIDRIFGGFEVEYGLAVELLEYRDRLELRIELPGVRKKDISVYVRDQVLVIEAEKKPELGEALEYRTTREYGRLRKALTLPEFVDQEKVAAEYSEGVLTLTFPKRPGWEGRRIEVR